MKYLIIAILTGVLVSTSAVSDDTLSSYSCSNGCRERHKYEKFLRLDCRFHNVEHHWGVNFCYASAIYQIVDRQFKNVRLAVGCDRNTLFNNNARIQIETTLDRFSPIRSATPGVEVFPQGQLGSVGTYTSVLDIPAGRFKGLCYVHPTYEPI